MLLRILLVNPTLEYAISALPHFQLRLEKKKKHNTILFRPFVYLITSIESRTAIKLRISFLFQFFVYYYFARVPGDL